MNKKFFVILSLVILTTFSITIGVLAAPSIKLMVNGKASNVQIKVIDKVNYVPLNSFAASLGYDVSTNTKTNTITVSIKPKQENVSTPTPKPTPKQTPAPTPTISIKTDYMLLYSNDGKTYLGKLTSNEFDSESIFNKFGSYGGEFASKSIFNTFGTYGGEFSGQSPFNEFATKPPLILLNGKVVGHLTINESVSGAVSPLGLKEYLIKLGY